MMIAAATQQAAASGKLFFNAFDVALLLVLGFGYWRGRRNGMTNECLPLCQWLAIVIAAGLGYQVAGDLLIQTGAVKAVLGKTASEKTIAYISSYLIIAGVMWLIFSFIKGKLKPKLEGSSLFGAGEYYLGMMSGVVRFACIFIFFLALLNAPVYSEADIVARKIYNNQTYGGGLKGYDGNFFPSLDQIQAGVFQESMTGPFIKSGLSFLLINTASPGASAAK